MKREKIVAERLVGYHFTGNKLRDGRPIPPIGEWLVHDGPIIWCESGLYACEHPFDALSYAPGSFLHKVELMDDLQKFGDKWAGRRRKRLAAINATDLLHEFARWCALQVIHLWDAPPIVREYIETGNEAIRDAARAASGEAARAPAWEAAKDAARNAARTATEDMARMAAWEAAREAAKEAVRAASGEAARAARAEAWEAAREAAKEAAKAVTRVAIKKTREAVREASRMADRAATGEAAREIRNMIRGAARAKQKTKFAEMVNKAFAP